MAPHIEPPQSWTGVARYLGPGLILTASIVGTGELIVTPKLGSEAGFRLLWFILVGCVIKVFVQIELGRYAITHGKTTLEAMNSVPGPRFRVSWLVWVWLILFLALNFQVAGMMLGIASMASLLGAPQELEKLWVLGVGVLTAGLLVSGRYRLGENFSFAMVALFTLFTVLALVALQQTEFRITSSQIAEGLSFHLPESFTTAFAAFGIIGVGTSELIFYPYWCLAKGYARNAGTNDGSQAWRDRARGWIGVMRIDALFSLVVYTSATIVFYLLGAAVLFGQGKVLTNENVIPLLSELYTESYGQVGLAIFFVGGLSVLFSTVFAATASKARVWVDAVGVFGIAKPADEEQFAKWVKIACVLLVFTSTIISIAIGKVVLLVFIGALLQGLMLPFLALAAFYFRIQDYRQVDAEKRSWQHHLGTACLALSTLAMTSAGIYQIWAQMFLWFGA